MLVDYFYWQYVVAPRWLLRVVWNLQRALVQFFSVKLMLRTLLSHWHKDAMPFHGGTLGDLGMAVLWNLISRVIGFLVRGFVLLIWLAAEIAYLVVVVFLLPLFLLWPLVVLVGFAAGLALVLA
jgi:hypothetical protein